LLLPEQIVDVPEIAPGAAGAAFTVMVCVEADELPQTLLAVTIIFPLLALAVAAIELVVDVPLHPEGSVHVYEVAPATAATLYVLLLPEQMVVVPEIVPGVDGAEVVTAIANEAAALLPQELSAVTVIFPLVELEVVVMVFVVDVPLQPDGNVQV